MEILSGNEAIARGAFEAGVGFAVGYPGTPSTEILENLATYKEVYCQWSPNEKVALEVGIGSSFAGVRTLVTMKHVGVNVAADALFTLAYTGVNAGIVIITADDPELHSSQNEQDNRHYAIASKIPIIEPADSQEAKSFLMEAFKISETYDTPVLFRLTTRISHSKSIVTFEENQKINYSQIFEKNNKKYVMIPAYARMKHKALETKLKKIEEYNSNNDFINKIEYNEYNIGVITSSITYQYAKEVFPTASFLKLGMIYPFPLEKVKDFVSKVKKVYVVEELDRVIETMLKFYGIEVISKTDEFVCGELNVERIKKAFNFELSEPSNQIKANIPVRPPVLCSGCPHRPVFYILNKLKVNVSGDIGCYTLGALPPFETLDTCVCMGASVGIANGMQKVRQLYDNKSKKTVAVIGDSTFVHSGITGIVDILYNSSPTLTIILDNSTTAMTGHQEHPGTGKTLKGSDTISLNYVDLAKAIGYKNARKISPNNLKVLESTLREELDKDEPSLVVVSSPCILIDKNPRKKVFINNEDCTGCKVCLKVACPALSYNEEANKVELIDALCNRCDLCIQLCNFGAIKYEDNS
jgi:indolepyruvate ferredoxin oxidoreductase, alpha subunit